MMNEYTNRKKFNELNSEQQRFVAKSVARDVERIAKDKNISVEVAYWFYVRGAFDGYSYK